MLNELGKSSSFGDIWPAFVDRGSAGFTSPSGRAFAGRSIAFGIAAAVAAWSILWHWVTTPPPTTTGRQPHRGFSVPKPDICSQSVYSARTYRSDLRNPRFQTHFLTLNPSVPPILPPQRETTRCPYSSRVAPIPYHSQRIGETVRLPPK